MTEAPPRPRIVDVAFWSWLTAGVLLILGGLQSAFVSFDTVSESTGGGVSDEQIRSYLLFFRGTGVLCILLGIGVGFLAGRTRSGDSRYRRAAVTLSLAGAAFLVVWSWLAWLPLPALIATLALIVAGGLATRPRALDWFEAVDQREGSHD